jgi:hypothetical protein
MPSSQVRTLAGMSASQDDRPLRVPPKSAPVNLRPISDASTISSTATTVTGRSVNDLVPI